MEAHAIRCNQVQITAAVRSRAMAARYAAAAALRAAQLLTASLGTSSSPLSSRSAAFLPARRSATTSLPSLPLQPVLTDTAVHSPTFRRWPVAVVINAIESRRAGKVAAAELNGKVGAAGLDPGATSCSMGSPGHSRPYLHFIAGCSAAPSFYRSRARCRCTSSRFGSSSAKPLARSQSRASTAAAARPGNGARGTDLGGSSSPPTVTATPGGHAAPGVS